jgi:tetratricopeptide (TPR) repeat protein
MRDKARADRVCVRERKCVFSTLTVHWIPCRTPRPQSDELVDMSDASGGFDEAMAFVAAGHIKKGDDAFMDHDFKGAILEYNKAIAHDSSNPIPYTSQSRAFGALNQWQESLEMTQKARKICPTYIKAIYRQAIALDRLGRIAQAIVVWKEALSVSPQSATFLTGLQNSQQKLSAVSVNPEMSTDTSGLETSQDPAQAPHAGMTEGTFVHLARFRLLFLSPLALLLRLASCLLLFLSPLECLRIYMP